VKRASALLSATLLMLLLRPAPSPGAARPPQAPPSCKPETPVDLTLRIVDGAPGTAAHIEAVVDVHRAVVIDRLEMRLPAGALWQSGPPALSGRVNAGARQSVRMGLTLPARGHVEVQALLHFRLAGGGALTRGARLSFDDGLPTRPARGRATQWNGMRVLEFPARGVGL
jgi:hypothetical protein